MLQQLDVLIGFVVIMSVVSLLITIVTQIISSALGLRGLNLADALVAMIHKIEPSLDNNAKALVDRVLTQPVISDSTLKMSNTFWPTFLKRATAIRADELLAILNDIKANRDGKTPPTERDTASKLLDSLNTSSAAASAAISALTQQLPTLAGESFAKTVAVIKELEDSANVSLSNLEKWFESAQDRAQQWFAMHTRICTMIVAVLMAFGLQLDAFRTLARLSKDPELREKLVALSNTIEKKADDIFSRNVSPGGINFAALTQLRDKANQEDKTTAAKITDPIPTDLQSTELADTWLKGKLGDDPKAGNFEKKFQDIVQDVSKENLNRARDQFGDITDAFSETKFQLVPDPYPGLWNVFSSPIHFLGILASAALLSLGAPFWFNILKMLTNLRPLLANQVDKEPSQTSGKSAK